MSQFVLYGGKGGVGKTTCAAATAVKLAGRGERVLVVSTDPAHSLGDAFETELGDEPTEIDANLWGVEPSADAGQDVYERIVSGLAAEFRSAGLRFEEDDVERLFAAGIVPGSDELAALRYVDDFADTDRWDRLVFDTAPTGETLRLLSLPEILVESVSTVAKVRGEVRSAVSSMRTLLFGPMGSLGRDPELDDLDRLREQMERVGARLRDPETTEFRVVLVPETLAIEESERLVERLRSFGVPIRTLVVNRVLTDVDERCVRCRTRAERQADRLTRIRETFPDLAMQELPELVPEAVGRDALVRLADEIEVD